MLIHTYIVIGLDFSFTGVIALLTFQGWNRWRRLDHAWTWYWCEYLVLTEPTRKYPKGVNEDASVDKRLTKYLAEPLGKLKGQSLEESILLQFERDDQKNGKNYRYVSEDVVLSLNTNAEGQLTDAWDVTPIPKIAKGSSGAS
jgi:hypothetical protein